MARLTLAQFQEVCHLHSVFNDAPEEEFVCALDARAEAVFTDHAQFLTRDVHDLLLSVLAMDVRPDVAEMPAEDLMAELGWVAEDAVAVSDVLDSVWDSLV